MLSGQTLKIQSQPSLIQYLATSNDGIETLNKQSPGLNNLHNYLARDAEAWVKLYFELMKRTTPHSVSSFLTSVDLDIELSTSRIARLRSRN